LMVCDVRDYLLLHRPVNGTFQAHDLSRRLLGDLDAWRRGDLQRMIDRARNWAFKRREKASRRKAPAPADALEEDGSLPKTLSDRIQAAVTSGKVGRAAAMVSGIGKTEGKPVPLTDKARRELRDLHPQEPRPAEGDAPPRSLPAPGSFDEIDERYIHSLCADLRGAAGPSAQSTDLLQSLCRLKSSAGRELREAVADVTRMIAEEELPPGCLAALTKSRLVALGKKDGSLRSVGIGEALRRLVCKAIARVAKQDIQDACGPLQLCCGWSAGCDAAAQALQEMWEEPGTEVVLMVDARNAFNEMCRAEALRTADRRCPAVATAFRNIYGHPSDLCLDGLQSVEGSTQGCPLGMAMFAVASIPLIEGSETDGVRQCWEADDSACAGSVQAAKRWFDALMSIGPRYGYHIKLSKTVALVKPGHEAAFRDAFGELAADHLPGEERRGLTVVSGEEGEEALGIVLGQRYLGAPVGTPAFRRQFVREKVDGWVQEIVTLAKLGKVHPHEAYALLVRAFIPRWRFVMRTADVEPELFDPLEDALVSTFFPGVFGWPLDSRDLRLRCALPARYAGLAIPIPREMAEQERKGSLAGVQELVGAIKAQDRSFQQDTAMLRGRREEAREVRIKALEQAARDLLKRTPGRAGKALEEALDSDCSDWLSYAPLMHRDLVLSRQAFRDAIALRMGVNLPDSLPAYCPSCGDPFSVSHALKCKKGGWVMRRHNEVARVWRALFKRVSDIVLPEPFVAPALPQYMTKRSTTRREDARADILVAGLFSLLRDAYLDCFVTDTGADCYVDKKAKSVLREKQARKRGKYDERVKPLGDFAPLGCSVYGTLAPEAEAILTLVVKGLDAEKVEKTSTVAWERVAIQVGILKAVSLCLRSRSQFAHPSDCVGPEDVEALEDCHLALVESRAPVEPEVIVARSAVAA
jgi:hypothetical protein